MRSRRRALRPGRPWSASELSRVVGLDYGSKRVGVAASDPLRMTAQPLAVLAADDEAGLRGLLEEWEAELVVVGLPVHLAGGEGELAAAARQFGAHVAHISGLPVEFYDERFTSTIAERAMLEAGLSRQDRRDRRDMVAAAVMLQGYLDRHRHRSNPDSDRRGRQADSEQQADPNGWQEDQR